MRKNVLFLLSSLLLLSCKNDNQPGSSRKAEIFSESFSDYKELTVLADYIKVADTSYSKEGTTPTHRITNVKRKKEQLILYTAITLDQERRKSYSLLDTLRVTALDPGSFVTIGYCEMKEWLPEEIIAVVEKTEKDTIQRVIKAWRANAENQRIEEILEKDHLICLNEFQE